MIVLHVEGLPLSGVNSKYMVSRGRLVLAPKYRQFKESVMMLSRVFKPESDTSRIGITIHVSTHFDADAIIKPTIDAIATKGGWDDARVDQLAVFKTHQKRTIPSKLMVEVYDL